MSERHKIALRQEIRGPRGDAARRGLAEMLEDATIGELDEGAVFEVEVTAKTYEEALRRVFDAVAATGADDELVFVEHPEIPEHWRRRGTEAPPS
jgi:phosphoribosylformylglycinamidine (FGAM) synthase PurS component